MSIPKIRIVGAGLAGSEACYQLARRGFEVELIEMRPEKKSPAHETDLFGELVCSNSLRGNSMTNAVGLLKEEMRRLGSIILDCAEKTQLPAGRALAVDRKAFATAITEKISSQKNIRVIREEVRALPAQGPAIICTGPLTSNDLAASLASLTGSDGLYYYDAIAPVVDAESLDLEVLFAASRYDEGEDYLNVPLDENQYYQLVKDLLEADKVTPHEFEKPQYFEGCLPVEVLAERGPLTLAHGPLKPVGLTDPRTGRRPFAVVQLRRENKEGTAYNLVGFQTRMKRGEQLRILKKLPGLGRLSVLRYGSIHRNTFVNAPEVLTPTLELKDRPGVMLAGQITGVEGYVESAACGLLAGLFLASKMLEAPLPEVPEETALGGLLWHLQGGGQGTFQPSNVTWAMLPPAPKAKRRADRRKAAALRGLDALEKWMLAFPESMRGADL